MSDLQNQGFCLMAHNDWLHQNIALLFLGNQAMHFLPHHIH